VLRVVVGEVEIGVGAVEDDDVEVRILLDQADELGEVHDGRRLDRVDRRVVESHPAVARGATVDAEMRPGLGPRFRPRLLLEGPASRVLMATRRRA
jgi:hypothetical protein